MKEKEMAIIGGFYRARSRSRQRRAALRTIADEVGELCGKFPVYPHRLGSSQVEDRRSRIDDRRSRFSILAILDPRLIRYEMSLLP